jgi:hypothetical protein
LEKISGKENEEGKINSSHLLKRIDDLCEALLKEKKKEKKNKKVPKKSEKVSKPEKVSSKPEKIEKKEKSTSSKPTPVIPLKKLTPKELRIKAEEYLETVNDVINKFKSIEDEDDENRFKKTTSYLLIIGTEIDKIVQKHRYENLEGILWDVVHDKANTAGDSDTLKHIYSRVKEQDVVSATTNTTSTTSTSSQSTKKKRKQYTSDSGSDSGDDDYKPQIKKKK